MYNNSQHVYDGQFINLILKGPFSYPNMVEKNTIGDGSCFFHAVTDGFYLPYKAGYVIENGKVVPFDRQQSIRKLRNDLADKLSQPVDKKHLPKNFTSRSPTPTYYDILSNGSLADYAKGSGLGEYSLGGMQQLLRSSNPVDVVYQELLSILFDIDIYVIDFNTGDIAVYPDSPAYQNRNSVVISYHANTVHYNLVGIDNGGTITTFFKTDDNFILAIKNRLRSRQPQQF